MKPCYNLHWNAIGKISLCKVSVISCPLLATILKSIYGSKPTTPADQNSVINWLSLVLHATYVDVHSLNIHLSCLKDSDFFFFIFNHHMHTHALEMIQHNANEPVCVGMCALLPQRAAGLSSSCRPSWSRG